MIFLESLKTLKKRKLRIKISISNPVESVPKRYGNTVGKCRYFAYKTTVPLALLIAVVASRSAAKVSVVGPLSNTGRPVDIHPEGSK
jgi:hypothetical protein